MTPAEVLALPMRPNDSGADTIGGYLAELLVRVIVEEGGFSGKRPFGNSGWYGDLESALVEGGAVDEWGCVDGMDTDSAGDLLVAAARAMGATPARTLRIDHGPVITEDEDGAQRVYPSEDAAKAAAAEDGLTLTRCRYLSYGEQLNG